MATPLMQIAVLPKQAADGSYTYTLLGLDSEGNVWRRVSTTQTWIKDTATFDS